MSTYVMLHGFTGAPASFDALVEAIGPSRVLRPFLTGHGPRPVLSASWAEEIDRLAALLDAEQVERAHLVGYSMGARVGLSLLAQAPERFARATLIGVRGALGNERERAARCDDDRRWIELLEREGLEPFIEAWQARPMFASQSPASRARAGVVRRMHTAHGLAHALRTLGLAEMPEVGRIAVPIELVTGALDTKFGALAEELARALPAAHTVVDGTGHDVLLERPDALSAILRGAA